MASEAANANDTAKPPALVCAPCWICLEDGPDDNGEPLVRDCSCRGETSAGYHVSCIIDYAKGKTNEAIDLREKKQKVVEAVYEPWKFCPNCKQPYMSIISLQLAEAWLEHTNHLPESHYVRFRARCFHLATLLLRAPISKDYQTIEIQAKALLQTLEESSSELAVSLLGGKSAGDQHIEAVVAREKVNLLAKLGTAKQYMGNFESAMVLFESALEYLDVAEASGHYFVDQVQRESIEGSLRDIKREMGLISPSEEVAELRKSLNQLVQKKEGEFSITHAKFLLACALKETDPPQYFEAVKLMKEASTVLTQMLGPEHKVVQIVKETYDMTRKEYKLYLQAIAKKGNEKS